MKTPRAAEASAYRIAISVLGAAVRLYFRHIEVQGAERLPASGPVLIAANHPAAFTDVMVLATRLPRRLHFLAMSALFEPWIRGLGLRLVGALPVYRSEDDPAQTFRNDSTFCACHEILDRGGVVLIFPEGGNETDRRLARMKTGAARLALAQEERTGEQGRLTLLPAGLHFEDRTAYQSDVVLSLGEPIDLAPYRAQSGSHPREAVLRLTGALQTALEELFLHIPEPAVTGLVHDLEHLYLDERKPGGDPGVALEVGRQVSECVEYFRHTDPERVYRLWRRTAGYRRKLEALELEDAALVEIERRPESTLATVRDIALGAVGLLPALLGGLIHYLPYRACEVIARRFASHPTQITSARIVAGLVLLPLSYGVLALLLWTRTGLGPRRIAAALAAVVGLGLFAPGYFRWLARQRARIRLGLLALNHVRLVARVRRERRDLVRIIDRARAQFLAAPGDGRAGPAGAE